MTYPETREHSVAATGGTPGDADQLWEHASKLLRDRLSDGTFSAWFSRAKPLGIDGDTFVLAEQETIPKYQSFNTAVVHTFHAGYDDSGPRITLLRQGCRTVRVRISDLSGMERVVVRADGSVVRRTTRKRFRVRLPAGSRRVSVRAIDLAEHLGARSSRLPRC